jgi:hypothetical protein
MHCEEDVHDQFHGMQDRSALKVIEEVPVKTQGSDSVEHALYTAWRAGGRGPRGPSTFGDLARRGCARVFAWVRVLRTFFTMHLKYQVHISTLKISQNVGEESWSPKAGGL